MDSYIEEFNFVLNNITYLLAFYASVYYYYNLSNYHNKVNGRYKWDRFTRIMSTFNALQCSYMGLNAVYNNMGIWQLNYKTPDFETYILLSFATYLFVDGILQIPDLYTYFSSGLILGLLHHFIGGFGIYLIGSRRKALFLGIYFALTEISTPLLNLSWWCYKKDIKNNFYKIVFISFYILFVVFRICTIPFLGIYLYINSLEIDQLPLLESSMVYYGSLLLVLLNSIWFISLSIKLYKTSIY